MVLGRLDLYFDRINRIYRMKKIKIIFPYPVNPVDPVNKKDLSPLMLDFRGPIFFPAIAMIIRLWYSIG